MPASAVIGDIHGDFDRLQELVGDLGPEVHLIAVGDYFDRWDGALEVVRWLMQRPNTTALLGNHDALILGVLEEAGRGESGRCMETWLWNGGQTADLERLGQDSAAAEWLRLRPAMTRVGDALLQHCDAPVYLDYGRTVDTVNARVRERLESHDSTLLLNLFADLCRRRQFYSPVDLDRYLEIFGAKVLVHGHTPHTRSAPMTLFNGRLVNVDGALSRGFGPGHRGFVHWLDG